MTDLTTTGDEPRRALHAYLSDEAHGTWHHVAGDLGCSVSAMLEAMAEGLVGPAGEERLGDVVKRARRIDADRRRR